MKRILSIILLLVVLTQHSEAQTPSSYRISFVSVGKPYLQIIAPSGAGTIKSIVGIPGSGQTYTYSNVLPFWAVEGTAIGTGSNLIFTANGRFWNAVPIFTGQPLPGITEPAGDASGGNWQTPEGDPVDPGTGQPKTTPGTPGTPGSPTNPVIPGTPGGGVGPGNPGGGDSGGGTDGSLTGDRYKATGILKNTYPGPMYFQVYLQSNGGTSRNWSTKTLQPGEATMIVLNEPFPFTWWAVPVLDMVEQDEEIPLPDPGDPVPDDPTKPGETPPYVPPLDSPNSPATGDVYGAVMRAAEIARTYGEQARQGVANTNRLLDDIKKKPSGTGGDGEGNGPGDVAGGTGGDGDELDEGDAAAAEGLGEAVGNLGDRLKTISMSFGSPQGDTSLAWSIPNLVSGGNVELTIEPFSSWFPTIRGAILLLISIWFVFELISSVKGALA